VYRFGTTGCKVTVAELIAWRYSVGLARNVVLPLANGNTTWL
jgi:hypothetical protein